MAIISPPLPSLILFSPTARGYVAYVAISPYLYSLFRFLSFLFSLSPIRSVPIFLLPFFIIPLSPLLAHLLYIPHGRASPHVTLQQVQQLNCARRFSTESKSAIFHPAYTIQIIVDLLFPPWLRRASRRAFISRERRLRDRSRTTTLFSSVIAVTRLCSF